MRVLTETPAPVNLPLGGILDHGPDVAVGAWGLGLDGCCFKYCGERGVGGFRCGRLSSGAICDEDQERGSKQRLPAVVDQGCDALSHSAQSSVEVGAELRKVKARYDWCFHAGFCYLTWGGWVSLWRSRLVSLPELPWRLKPRPFKAPMVEGCGFPPFRQEKGEKTGHGASVAGRDRVDSVALFAASS